MRIGLSLLTLLIPVALASVNVLFAQAPVVQSEWTEQTCRELKGPGSYVIEWEWAQPDVAAQAFEVRQWRPPSQGTTHLVDADAFRSNRDRRHWSVVWVDAPGNICWAVRVLTGPKTPYVPAELPKSVAVRERPRSVPGPPTTMTVVQRVNTNTETVGTAVSTPNFGVNPTTGNLIVVLVQRQQSGATIATESVVDTLGNRYVATPDSPLDNFPGGVAARNLQSIFYARNIKGGGRNAVKVTFASAVEYMTIAAFEIAGADTLDPYVTGSGKTGGSGSAVETGPLNVAQEAIIVAIFESDNAGSGSGPVPFDGFTQSQQDGRKYVWDTYKVVTSGETAGAELSAGAAGKWGILAAAFKARPASPRPD